MTPRLAERLSRLELAYARGGNGGDDEFPPGMVAVLMYGIAVHLGGFPSPEGAAGPYLPDTLSDALARGLGYDDDTQMRTSADRPGEWAGRFNGSVSRLFVHLGLDVGQAGSAEAFRTFVRMLDEFAAAKSTWGAARGWDRIGDELDRWMRFAGYMPEVIRSEARQ